MFIPKIIQSCLHVMYLDLYNTDTEITRKWEPTDSRYHECIPVKICLIYYLNKMQSLRHMHLKIIFNTILSEKFLKGKL